MITFVLLSVLSSLAAPDFAGHGGSGADETAPAGVPAARPPVAVQDGAVQDDVIDERPEIQEQLKTFKGHVKKRGVEDEQAIAIIDVLYQEFPESGPKDKKEIVKGLEACFKLKRTKELEPGVPDDRLYFAAAVAMESMAPESVKPLIGLLGHKSHRKNVRLQARIAKSIGNTRDERGIKPLLGLLKDKAARMQAAGADALGAYESANLRARKDIFKALLDTMMGQKAIKDTDATNAEAHERWGTISGPIIASLQRLSGHDERNPDQWQRWWNKNKKADWDA